MERRFCPYASCFSHNNFVFCRKRQLLLKCGNVKTMGKSEEPKVTKSDNKPSSPPAVFLLLISDHNSQVNSVLVIESKLMLSCMCWQDQTNVHVYPDWAAMQVSIVITFTLSLSLSGLCNDDTLIGLLWSKSSNASLLQLSYGCCIWSSSSSLHVESSGIIISQPQRLFFFLYMEDYWLMFLVLNLF